MSGKPGKSGGKRNGAGRKPAPNKKQYSRRGIEVPPEPTPLEKRAAEWYNSLTPKDRLAVVVEAFEFSLDHSRYRREIGTVDENGELHAP